MASNYQEFNSSAPRSALISGVGRGPVQRLGGVPQRMSLHGRNQRGGAQDGKEYKQSQSQPAELS